MFNPFNWTLLCFLVIKSQTRAGCEMSFQDKENYYFNFLNEFGFNNLGNFLHEFGFKWIWLLFREYPDPDR